MTIAAFNGPRSLTLSGPRISLEAIAAELEPQGVFARLVRVDHPFHHPLMQPASEELEAALADLAPKKETVPFFSTVTGGTAFRRRVRRRATGDEESGSPCSSRLRSMRWRTSAWMCGWKSARIPRSWISIQECLAARGDKSSSRLGAART